MRKGSLAVTAITGLVSWSALSSAAEPAHGKQAAVPPSAAPDAAAGKNEETPPAKGAPAKGATPAKPAAPAKGATTKDAPPAADTPAGAASSAPAQKPPPPKGAAPADEAAAPEGAGTEREESTGTAPPDSTAAPRPAPGPGGARAATGFGPIGLFPEQGRPPPAAATTAVPAAPKSNDDVLAEDWWSHARPVFEIHGYFRTRAELFHNFSLGRNDNPLFATWAQPADNSFATAQNNAFGPQLCTSDEAGYGGSDNPKDGLEGCRNKTQAGANIRFRLNPELHISDNLRINSQIDILDNVTLGSNPSGYAFMPASGGGNQVVARSGYAPNSVLDDTTVAPRSAVNSLSDSIVVKRVWAEYSTPVGELRFGRMPDHFGLGMVHNSGDGYDDDYSSTIDRLQFITAIKPLDLYVGGSWDFPNEGPLRQPTLGPAYDAAQLDDVSQWTLILMRKQSDELVKTELSHDKFVVNGGAYVTYRKQLLASDVNGSAGTDATAAGGANVPDMTPDQTWKGYSRRNANIWLPDLWFQLRYKKFRFEVEGAAVLGSMDNASTAPLESNFSAAFDPSRKLQAYGLATQIEQRLVEDKLRLGFDFGVASGDSAAFNPNSSNNLIPEVGQQPVNSNTISTFRFHPTYRVDLILHRYLLGRVQGTYYFKPSVEYDFMRKASGQRLGGGAGVVWSRASEVVQTPGHARDLGIEIDGKLYFQAKDGALNDKPGVMGGFYAMLEYGVLFPLAGMGYQSVEKVHHPDISAAQLMRLYLGVIF